MTVSARLVRLIHVSSYPAEKNHHKQIKAIKARVMNPKMCICDAVIECKWGLLLFFMTRKNTYRDQQHWDGHSICGHCWSMYLKYEGTCPTGRLFQLSASWKHKTKFHVLIWAIKSLSLSSTRTLDTERNCPDIWDKSVSKLHFS